MDPSPMPLMTNKTVAVDVRSLLLKPLPARVAAWLSLALLLISLPVRATVAEAWVRRYGPGGTTAEPNALAVDNCGNLLVTGYAVGLSWKEYVTIKYSGTGVPLWTNIYNGPGKFDDLAVAVAADSSCSVIVTGNSGSDIATIKYSSAGTPLWTNRYSGPVSGGTDQVSGVAVDDAGNVFVTGYSDGGGSSSDLLTIAYSSTGAGLWTNRYNAPANSIDGATAIRVDRIGNVIVSGYSFHTGRGYDYITIKYSNAGSPIWTNFYNGDNGTDTAQDMVVDTNGNVFVTGTSYSAATRDREIVTVAYSSAGAPLWTNRYGDSPYANDVGRALALDQQGHVFVTGSLRSGGIDENYVTLCYSNEGSPLWTNRYDGLSGLEDRAQAIAVDNRGNVFVSGYSLEPLGGDNFVTLMYSNNGVPQSTNHYDGPAHGTDVLKSRYAMAIGHDGEIYVTGASSDAFATIKYVLPPLAPTLVCSPVKTGSEFTMRYQGTPGKTYTVEYAGDLLTGTWNKLTNATAPATDQGWGAGVFEVRESVTAQSRFYRIAYPAY